jgi:8-oxo-dGTP diphosphatase
MNESGSLDEIWAKASKGIAAAGVILNSHGHVLLVKHSYGPLNWELPGGAAERDESRTETSLREVLEETGLRVSAERLTGVYYERHGPGREAVHFVFLCRIVDEVATPRPDLDEVMACAYWPPETLPRPISDFTIRRIQHALGNHGPGAPGDDRAPPVADVTTRPSGASPSRSDKKRARNCATYRVR